jgi:hypothetical protein
MYSFRLKFWSVEEFLEEAVVMLKHLPADPVARVTCRRRRDGELPIVRVDVVAYINGPVGNGYSGVVELEERVGEYLGDGPDYKKVMDDADKVMDALKAALQKHGYTIRAGSFV